MENKDLLKESSTNEPRWKDVVNIDEILNKIGPEGCHELAEKLVEIANEDMQNALKQSDKDYKESIDEIEWFKHPKEPFLNTAVVVELDNKELAIGQLDENYSRKCWLIQGMGKMFWRNIINSINKWRWMTSDEMVEYHLSRTLKIIGNDEETEV